MKRFVKARSADLLGLVDLRDSSQRVVVLCYHSVHPTKSFASATPELFERHLAWLQDHSEIVCFANVKEAVRRTPRGLPTVALTFDDGYSDNYHYAFPLLEKYRTPATFFVTVGLLERNPAVLDWFRRRRQCPELEIQPLEWTQLLEMRSAGFQFGTHTYTHTNLARLDRAQVELELTRSKQILEEHLGETVSAMAYPFGKRRRHFTSETVQLVKEAGYDYAAAVLFRRVMPTDSEYELPRFFITKDDVRTLSQKIAGSWDFVGWWQEKAPIWAARRVSGDDFGV